MESIFGHLTFTALIPDYGTLTHKDHWQSWPYIVIQWCGLTFGSEDLTFFYIYGIISLVCPEVWLSFVASPGLRHVAAACRGLCQGRGATSVRRRFWGGYLLRLRLSRPLKAAKAKCLSYSRFATPHFAFAMGGVFVICAGFCSGIRAGCFQAVLLRFSFSCPLPQQRQNAWVIPASLLRILPLLLIGYSLPIPGSHIWEEVTGFTFKIKGIDFSVYIYYIYLAWKTNKYILPS